MIVAHSTCTSCSALEYDSENLNSEDIYRSLRGVSEAIQSFSFRSQDVLMEPLRRDGMVRKLRPHPSHEGGVGELWFREVIS